MFKKKLPEQPASLVEQAVKSTQRSAGEALDSLSGAISEVRQQTEPLLERTGEKISLMAHSGVEHVLDASRHLREQALQTSQSSVEFIKEKPVKSILIAAAAGAALMALVSLTKRSGDRR